MAQTDDSWPHAFHLERGGARFPIAGFGAPMWQCGESLAHLCFLSDGRSILSTEYIAQVPLKKIYVAQVHATISGSNGTPSSANVFKISFENFHCIKFQFEVIPCEYI